MGALIAIDHILYIQKEPLTDGKWNVVVYLTGEVSVQWNQEPIGPWAADQVLAHLRTQLQEAISLA